MAMPMRFTKTFMDWDRMPVLLDMEQTCCVLMCSDVTVVKHIQMGHFKGNKLGNKWRIDRDSLREFFQKTPFDRNS